MKVSSMNVNMSDFKTSFIKEIITKKNNIYNIHSTIDGDFYTYQQEIKNNWKIGTENVEVLE